MERVQDMEKVEWQNTDHPLWIARTPSFHLTVWGIVDRSGARLGWKWSIEALHDARSAEGIVLSSKEDAAKMAESVLALIKESPSRG